MVDLISPTSLQMKKSFILNNNKDSDMIYKQLMLRQKHSIIVKKESSLSNGSYYDPETKFRSFIKSGRPPARDGHTSTLVAGRWMLVFGGDRHHMPYNDLYILDLAKEFDDHAYVFSNSFHK